MRKLTKQKIQILKLLMNMKNFSKLLLLLLGFNSFLLAQPKLDIEPGEIEFEDIFKRFESVYLINEGDQPLIIDSIHYNPDLYFLRFDGPWQSPHQLMPGDSVKMDCILIGFYYISSFDTTDTLFVYNNGEEPIDGIKIKIDFFDDDQSTGIIQGTITDGTNPLPEAEVNIIYGGNYILKKSFTDINGNFSCMLPPGEFTVAVQKDSFYVGFYDGQFAPFYAKKIMLEADSTVNINITLTKMLETNQSVSGQVIDSVSGFPSKGIVVIRTGGHNPSKMIQLNDVPLPDNIYTVFTDNQGFYTAKNIINPGYYYVQAFSDFFIPSYFGDPTSTVFWQLADSVLVDSPITGKNIELQRDSSYGGGKGSGFVNIMPGKSFVPSDAMLYAQSVTNNLIYNYGFTQTDGTFDIGFLPQGTYRLVAQRIGFSDAFSKEFSVDPLNPMVDSIELTFYLTSAGDDGIINPDEIVLYQNYPNPFNPSTTIEFSIPVRTNVSLKITNLLGEQVAELYNGEIAPGRQKFTFDASGLSTGIYFVNLVSPTSRQTKKILLLK